MQTYPHLPPPPAAAQPASHRRRPCSAGDRRWVSLKIRRIICRRRCGFFCWFSGLECLGCGCGICGCCRCPNDIPCMCVFVCPASLERADESAVRQWLWWWDQMMTASFRMLFEKCFRLYALLSVCVSGILNTQLIQKPFDFLLDKKHLIKMDFCGETHGRLAPGSCEGVE